MEKFLLDFTNSFKNALSFRYAYYTKCIEYRCGLFQFDDFRPLPRVIIIALNLTEVSDWDDEKEKNIFSYTTNFELP